MEGMAAGWNGGNKSMSSLGITLFSSFFVLLLLNVPITISLALSSLITMYFFDISLDVFASTMYSSTAKFTLLAIPFFILAGVIMERAGISKRLIHFAGTLTGHLTGGLAIVTVLTSMFFAAISGSGPATVAALGTILIPAMAKAGYNRASASALLATSGAIGIIIPPSIALVVYGVIAEVSIGELFITGIVPGIIMGTALMIVSYIMARKNNYGKSERASYSEMWAAFKDAFWGLLAPVVILGGIYGGVFTPTEAAVVAVFYGLFVGVVIYREIKWTDLKDLLVDSSITTATVMIIVASASLFAWIVTIEGVAENISGIMTDFSTNPIVVLLMLNVILLIAGAFLDAISAFYIFLPIFIPILNAAEIDLLLFGVIMTMNLAIGLVTPPVGVNLYVAAGIGGVSLKAVSRAVLPYLIASIIALLIVTYIPGLSTWLLK
jgi:C4-dicarboxylate transporter DctM subunit